MSGSGDQLNGGDTTGSSENGWIAGVAVGSAAVVAILAGVFYYFRRKRRVRRERDVSASRADPTESTSDVGLLPQNSVVDETTAMRALLNAPQPIERSIALRPANVSPAGYPAAGSKAAEYYQARMESRLAGRPVDTSAVQIRGPALSTGTWLPLSMTSMLEATQADPGRQGVSAVLDVVRRASPSQPSTFPLAGTKATDYQAWAEMHRAAPPHTAPSGQHQPTDYPVVPMTEQSCLPLSMTSLIEEAGHNTQLRTLELHAEILRLRQAVDAMQRGTVEEGMHPPRYYGPLSPLAAGTHVHDT